MEVTAPTVPAEPAPGARHLRPLRAMSLGTLVTLVLEYGLGIGVNLFVNVPDADKGVGVGKAFGKAMSGPAGLAAHAGVGLLLLIAALSVLVRGLLAHRPAVAVLSVLGFLSVVGAAFSGASFVNDGRNSSSMTMAVLTGVAMICYALNLYLLPPAPRRRG